MKATSESHSEIGAEPTCIGRSAVGQLVTGILEAKDANLVKSGLSNEVLASVACRRMSKLSRV